MPLVGDGVGLDIVFVANLADDLLEQVFDRDQASGATIFIDDDGHLRLTALHLLEQLRDPLALRHHERRSHQCRQRRLGGRRQRHHVLHEHDADDIVEIAAVHRNP